MEEKYTHGGKVNTSTYPTERVLQHRGDAPSFVKKQTRRDESDPAASAQNGSKLRDIGTTGGRK